MSAPTIDPSITAIESQARVLTGPLTPLLTPPPPASTSPLPPRVSRHATLGHHNRHWSCETFIFPAAFPRTFGSVHRAQKTASGLADEGGKIDGPTALKKLYDRQLETHERVLDVEKDVEEVERQRSAGGLRLAVNRYAPRGGEVRVSGDGKQKGLTLVFAHANGFHKETWEPTIEEMLVELESSKESTLPVEEIWSLDVVNQGDSGVLNETVLGDSFDWADNGRDILSFVLSHLDSSHSPPPSTETLPTITLHDRDLLSLDSSAPAPGLSQPTSRSWRDRLVVGIGHSVSGSGLVYASSALPSLFSSVVIVDPVLPAAETDHSFANLALGALKRRERWGSRNEAFEAFSSKAFFKSWDPRVLDLYCATAIRDKKEGGVELKSRAKSEALLFGDPNAIASRRASARLSSLPPSLPVHFILADKNRSQLSEDHIEKMLARVRHSTHTRIAGAGHLVAQEQPAKTGKAIADFLRKTYTVGRRAARL